MASSMNDKQEGNMASALSERRTSQEVRWIPTKTRLPDEGSDVFAFWPPMNGVVHGGCYGVATYNPGHWHNPEDDEDDYCEPSHWMPLPPPPVRPQDSIEAK